MLLIDRYRKALYAHKSRFNVICLILILFLSHHSLQAQKPVVIKATELKIAGKTNVSDFSCNLRNINLNDTIAQEPSVKSSPEVLNGLQLTFRVSEFTCDLPLMTRDFQDLLQSKEHPYILLSISDLQYTETALQHQSGNVKTTVRLRIADKTRTVQIDKTSVHTIRNKTILSGTHRIRMTDFDIEPPVKFFGTVRTQDMLEIQFNIQLE